MLFRFFFQRFQPCWNHSKAFHAIQCQNVGYIIDIWGILGHYLVFYYESNWESSVKALVVCCATYGGSGNIASSNWVDTFSRSCDTTVYFVNIGFFHISLLVRNTSKRMSMAYTQSVRWAYTIGMSITPTYDDGIMIPCNKVYLVKNMCSSILIGTHRSACFRIWWSYTTTTATFCPCREHRCRPNCHLKRNWYEDLVSNLSFVIFLRNKQTAFGLDSTVMCHIST